MMSIKRAIIDLLIVLAVIAVPLQALIDPAAANLTAASIVLCASLPLLIYVGRSSALQTHPLSTFALLGLCLTTQLGALLAQTAGWTPLRSSLYDPIYTFGALAICQSIALVMHVIYRFFSRPPRGGVQLVRGFFDWAGIYRTPSAGALWIMGWIGLATFFFARSEGIAGKVAGAFSFLTWAPYLIVFYIRDLGEAYCHARLQRILLGAYTLIAVLLGLALNTRAIMFSGIVTIVLINLLSWLRSDAPLTGRGVAKIAALALLVAAVAAPISDLATSMAIARQWRGKVSASQMIRTTYDVWRNPGLIAAYRAEGELASRYRAYDEHYVGNPLLERFITTKYHDNAFHFARAISTEESKARLAELSTDLVWAVLPDPLLRMLNIGIDKSALAYSMGDYLAYLSRGMPLGGHKIGSMFAQGIALFGVLFPFVYAAICLALFALMDLLSLRSLSGAGTVSALGMMTILNIFMQGLCYEGLHDAVYLCVRNFMQMVLTYAMIFALARLMLPNKPPAPGVPTLPAWQVSP